jgi:lipoprotein-releasing system permease protein
MRFELFIASRYLRAKRRQAFIGVITGISILGVAAGVASLIVALAINNGFRQDLQDSLLRSTSHVNLLRTQDDGIKDWRPLMERLSKQPHVIAAAPDIYEQVLISRGPRARGAVLKGVIPVYEKKVSDLLNSVKTGSADALEENKTSTALASTETQSPSSLEGAKDRVAAMPPIILGKDMAAELGAEVGSVVLVVSPQGELTPFGMVPKYNRFRVAGIFDSGFYDYDSAWAFTRLADSQQLFGLGDLVSVLEFKIDDIYQAEKIGYDLEQAAGNGFMSTNWIEQNKPLFRALRLERLVTFITIGLIVFVAALNILISLTMMVMEKTRDIAVLMSMGTRKSQIRRVFIAQGMLIGLIGTAIGLVIGYALSWTGGHYHLLALAP